MKGTINDAFESSVEKNATAPVFSVKMCDQSTRKAGEAPCKTPDQIEKWLEGANILVLVFDETPNLSFMEDTDPMSR
jgi:hypothetical protein